MRPTLRLVEDKFKNFVSGKYNPLGCRKPKKAFPCPQCDRSYKNKSSLNRHLQYECGTSKRYVCPLCDARMFYSSSLQEHILFAHS